MLTPASKLALLDRFAQLFQSLAHPIRLGIIELLGQRPRTVGEVAVASAATLANVSAHLRVLGRAGLVAVTRHGRERIYRLTDDEQLLLVRQMQAAAERRAGAQWPGSPIADGSPETIGAAALRRRLRQRDVTLIDVRPRDEFIAGHIGGAHHVDPDRIPREVAGLPRRRAVVAYCRGPYCVFAHSAARVLRERGRPVAIFPGGVPEWRRAGFEVRIGPEQSTRRVAGVR